MAAKRTVPVTIQGREYRIRAETTPEAVKAAAELLNETIDRVRTRAGTVDSVDVAVLAALNIANTLVGERQSGISSEVLGPRIDELVTLVESALAEPLGTH
jgi:cell division protein ZapA (FtsZ GTPase activity inhibitor)